eukprot:CAMPEP_0185907782 /NCGR_PEP_ID=MMETSP0196C-20130402/7670_1 /TAXON_ID=2932 /ORGANISM="Alexandrium fundyense, Strain CCMP1719" /LENGTH=66 /DNA_ID=CAMNT_0028627833 /DNA_START=118 /DNA_END=315 /DNA_ORIENTATION=-
MAAGSSSEPPAAPPKLYQPGLRTEYPTFFSGAWCFARSLSRLALAASNFFESLRSGMLPGTAIGIG